MIVHKGVRIRDDAKKIGLMQEDIVEEVQIKIDFTERMPWKFWHVPLQYKSLIFIEVCNLILLPTKLTRIIILIKISSSIPVVVVVIIVVVVVVVIVIIIVIIVVDIGNDINESVDHYEHEPNVTNA